jgi:hypothetical protein
MGMTNARPCITASLLAMVGLACATSAPRQTELMKEKGAAVSTEALRERSRALAAQLIAVIDDAGDRIARSSDDSAVQRAAVAWKRDTVDALYTALFFHEPAIGLLDAWAMLIQTEDRLSSPEAKLRFGAAADEALAVVRAAERRVAETFVWAKPTGDPEQVRAKLARWAAEHPVEGSLATRRRLGEDLAQWSAAADLTTFSAVPAMEAELRGITARLDLLQTVLPRAVMWDAEILFYDRGGPALKQALRRADEGMARFDELLRWLGSEGLQQIAEGERKAAIAAIDQQRIAIGELVDRERSEVSALVARERALILEQVARERVQLMADVQKATAQATRDAKVAAQDVADHVLLRVALLVGGAILLWAAATLVLRRAASHRPRTGVHGGPDPAA